jgi:hypothetical protein
MADLQKILKVLADPHAFSDSLVQVSDALEKAAGLVDDFRLKCEEEFEARGLYKDNEPANDDPTGDPFEWNRQVLRKSAGRTVRFDYQKPATTQGGLDFLTGSQISGSVTTTRTVEATSYVDSDEPNQAYLTGVDQFQSMLSGTTAVRQFRLDRIVGYVTYAD